MRIYEDTPTPAFLEMAPAVTTDQLRQAVASALTTVKPGSPSTPIMLLGIGVYGSITGESMARMAAAISRTFPAHTEMEENVLKGLIWRGIFAFSDVVSDARFVVSDENGDRSFGVDPSLFAALATTPMPFGGDIPVDAIFATAARTPAAYAPDNEDSL